MRCSKPVTNWKSVCQSAPPNSRSRTLMIPSAPFRSMALPASGERYRLGCLPGGHVCRQRNWNTAYRLFMVLFEPEEPNEELPPVQNRPLRLPLQFHSRPSLKNKVHNPRRLREANLPHLSPDNADGVCQAGIASAVPATALAFRSRNHVALAGSQEQIALQAMLLVIKFAITSVHGVQLLVVAALHDTSLLDDQNLVRAPDRRKPVCNHKGRAVLHKVRESLLNQHLRFRIQA